MSDQILVERFSKEIFECLDETFEQVHGIYLDKGTSLFETLESITAEDASRSVAEKCPTIAAQIEHIRYYLDVLNNAMKGKETGKADWQEIWQSVREVTPQEWEEKKRRLRESYQQVLATLRSFDGWRGEGDISGALAVLVHTAYHLGGVRQAWCAVRSVKSSG